MKISVTVDVPVGDYCKPCRFIHYVNHELKHCCTIFQKRLEPLGYRIFKKCSECQECVKLCQKEV